MSGRKKKYTELSIVEPASLSVKEDNDEESPDPYLQENIDQSEMPAGNFLKLEWNLETSPDDQESVELRNRLQTEEEGGEMEEVIIKEEEEEEDTSQVDEESNLYLSYSLLTDHLISGHFLSDETVEEVYVFNDEPSQSEKVITDILCDKFKCHHCNLSFLSHQFYMSHLKKCASRRSSSEKSNNNNLSVDFNSQKRKIPQTPRNSVKTKKSTVTNPTRRSPRIQYTAEESSDSLESYEFLNVEDVSKSGDSLSYKCDSCKCFFYSFNEMKDHLCFRDTQHQCDLCLKKCPTKAAFYEHLERSHKIQISSVLSAPSSKKFPVIGAKVVSNNKSRNNRLIYSGIMNSS